MKQHQYQLNVTWTGNTGTGTSAYTAYERSHTINIAGKPTIQCSSDAAFRGDATKQNPEDFFVAAIASCHMLWYLHLCATAGVIVTAYTDNTLGYMEETPNGSGKFTSVILQPTVTVLNATMIEKALALHHDAHQFCFIANSCNFPITHHPNCKVQE